MKDLPYDIATPGMERTDGHSLVSSRRLRVLVVDEEMPFPPDAGKRIRTWNLLRRLAQRHSVTFLCYGQKNDSAKVALESAGIKVCLVDPLPTKTGLALYGNLALNFFSTYPYSVVKHYTARFQDAYATLLRSSSWDLVQCEWTPYARFVLPKVSTPILIATHNVEAQIWERRAQHANNFAARLFFGSQARKMQRFEITAVRCADAATAVSEPEAAAMRDWGARSVTVVPNGVDVGWYEQANDAAEVENELLSIASLDWFPNADALEYFASEILPRIRQERPSAILRIVGRRPPDALKQKLAGVPGIDFVGQVDDVRPYLKQASVIVVPLRIGGGSRLKILEALAAGKAVVSTTVGAEGLHLIPSEEICIADRPDEFAREVVRLLGSREARAALGAAGRARVNKDYSWDRIASLLESVWLETARKEAVPDVRLTFEENLRVPV
jgi:polysaccharide biosynthesis protein PslH